MSTDGMASTIQANLALAAIDALESGARRKHVVGRKVRRLVSLVETHALAANHILRYPGDGNARAAFHALDARIEKFRAEVDRDVAALLATPPGPPESE